MWSFKRVTPFLSALALAFAAPLVSGCSFSPVYGDGSALEDLDIRYAEPGSRLDQIVYQEFALRLGTASRVDAPLVTITTSASSRRVGRSSDGTPSTAYEAIVSGSAVLTDDEGTKLISVSRKASAGYTTNGQLLADEQAREEATERAALALAQQLRLVFAAEYTRTLRAR